jgi:hypothetical protein
VGEVLHAKYLRGLAVKGMFSACEQKRNPDCPTKASRAWRTRIVHVSNAAEMKLVFNQQQKAPQSIQVASYLNDPTDAFTVVVFSLRNFPIVRTMLRQYR